MTDGHCFISYSVADGLDFATKLFNKLEGGHPHVDAWLDKNRLKPGDDWDEQIAKAIRDCQCLVFALSVDSVAEGSTCKQEWVWALKYKKPVVPLLIDRKAQLPFRLGSRQYIDFTSDFEAGLAKLREHILYLNSEEGKLDELKHRLEDAHRDLRRAKPEDSARVQADIEELKNQIQVQERIVADPEAAKKQTEQNIQNGLERERKPQLPVASFQSSKFINQPPGVAQNYFQDRLMETEQAILFLKNEAQRVLTVVGRGGAGKTAMTCRLLKHIENGGLPDDYDKKHGKVDIDGIVYLSEAGSRKVNFANLFDDLCKLLPAASAEKLSALYREPQTSTESKTVQLLAAFQGLKQVIVLLDNFENVVDAEKGQVKDAELDEALRAILHAPHHPVKIIITTRVSARELDAFEPARQRLLPLDTGLQPEYAREAFVLMDEGNLVGIKNAGADLLNLAVTRTLGLPRALEALYAVLRTDRFTTLQELLDLPILPEQVVQAYVGEAFNRLDTNAQKVMQALAVYNRPVTPAAVDYLLAPHIPAIDSAPILQRLANMGFALKENGRFYLHPVDREFAFGLVIENSDLQPAKLLSTHLISSYLPFTQHDLTSRAADYFRQARKPRAEWKELNDLSANLSEFDLRCDANDYNTAATVLKDIDYDYLLLWGHAQLLINMHQKIKGLINDKSLVMWNLNVLGLTYTRIGKVKEAINFYQQGLNMAQEDKDRRWESVFLGNIGSAHYSLSDIKKSISFFEQRLGITENFSDRRLQAFDLENLGSAYVALGEPQKAIKLHEQALSINYEFKNRRGEGNTLGNLGNAYYFLGEINKAIKCQEQALVIRREIHDRRGEGNALSNLGSSYAVLGNIQKSLSLCELSLEIAREIGDKRGEGMALNNLADKYAKMGKKIESLECYEKGLECAQETGNKYGESISENGIANFLIEEGKCQQSIQHSHKSNQLGVAMSNPKVCSKSFISLAQVYLSQNDLVNARATIEAALQYDVPNNNHNASALHGIIASRQGEQGDEVAARGAFLRAIGQADEILSKTAEFYEALDAKGLSICGLMICGEDGGQKTVDSGRETVDDGQRSTVYRQQAIETFRKARQIAPHAGVVKDVLRLFDELAKCDTEGILKEVRDAAEGNVER